MRSPFAYSPRPGPLGSAGPGAAAAYLGVLALIALSFSNPIVIAGAGAAVVVSGLVSNARESLVTAARWALSLAVLIVVVNAIVVRRGDTVLVRGFDLPVLGPLDITLEALTEGAVLGLRIVVVLLAFAVFSACVDPDRMLGALRPIARRSALTATLITRLVPLTGRDHARLREAASLRGPAAAPVGRAASARRLLAGSLDRASDVAATLELRGYGLTPPPRAPRQRRAHRRSRNPSSLLLAVLATLALCAALGARVAALGSFDAYPTIRVDTDVATIALALFLPGISFLLLTRRAAEPQARWPWPGPEVKTCDGGPADPPSPIETDTSAALVGSTNSSIASQAGSTTLSKAPSTNGDAVLEIAELSYRYPGEESYAIDRVTFEVPDGELVLLSGESGSGKTSLLRVGCGLIPHFHGGAISGRARIVGRDLRDTGPSELAAAAGFVAQDPEAQVVSALAGSELELPLSARGRLPAECSARLVEVATELGMVDLLERTTDSLSSGELQRVAIAAALVASPRLLLLDEPTSQLDPGAAQELTELVLRIRARGTAVVLAEHRLKRWLAIADRMVVMEQGAIVFDGPPLEVERLPEADIEVAQPCRGSGPDLGPRHLAGARSAQTGPPGSSSTPARDQVRRVRAHNGGGPADAPNGAGPHRSGKAERVLQLSDLRIELPSRPSPVLTGVELSIERGERIALIGANGAGKSTLLRACAGAIRPTTGQVKAQHGCALLGQHPGDYIVRERVADELPGTGGAVALASVGLAWAAERDPRDLSGGERQRLALAIALAGRGIGGEPPGLVCLDEPTRGMDRTRKEELAELVLRLSDRGAAVVVATHDLEFASGFAERAIVIDEGAIVADGDFDALLCSGRSLADGELLGTGGPPGGPASYGTGGSI